MKPWKLLVCGFFLVGLSTLVAHPAPANGSKGKRLVYEAKGHWADASQGECSFSVELEPILFRIVTVQNRYKVIRINILNRSQKPLRLSLEKDSIQIRVGQRTLSGMLNLSGSDPSWWNSLDPDLRKALAYPDQAAIPAGEEENVFVFVPASDLPTVPDEFLFKIDSFSPPPISIRPRRVAAAM